MIGRQRRCAGRGNAAAGADVLRSPLLIFLGRKPLEFGFASVDSLLKDLLEEWNAPTAAGPRAATLRQLARHLGFLNARVIHELAPRNMEAVTNLGVEFHVEAIRGSNGAFGVPQMVTSRSANRTASYLMPFNALIEYSTASLTFLSG
jgi:hypothetical protein